jgi:HEAT repeat protein
VTPAHQSQEPSRSLVDAIDAFRDGDLSHTRVSRLSDLSRDEAAALANAWGSIPEETRADLVRRCDELSEERVDVNFRRALRIALSDPSAVVRQLAVAALWEDESADLLDRLRRLLVEDPSPDVRAQAASALERFSHMAVSGGLDRESADALRTLLLEVIQEPGTANAVHRRAIEALGPFGGEPGISAAINDAFDSGDHGLQCSAIYAMGRSLQSQWLPVILAGLETDDAEMRFEAARAAGALGAADALPALMDAALDEDAEVRHAAIAAIGQIGGRGAVRALERLAEDAGDADLELIEASLDEAKTMLDPFDTTA